MKTNLDGFFKISEDAKDGVWFNIGNGIRFCVKGINFQNAKIKAAHAKHFKPYSRQMDLGTLDPDEELDLMVKFFVDASLVDWEGVQMDGKDLEFNQENAVKLLKSLPELFDALFKHAQDFKNYREDLGNS